MRYILWLLLLASCGGEYKPQVINVIPPEHVVLVDTVCDGIPVYTIGTLYLVIHGDKPHILTEKITTIHEDLDDDTYCKVFMTEDKEIHDDYRG
jgi:hypothetical protein